MATEKTKLTQVDAETATYNAIIDETNQGTKKIVSDMASLHEATKILQGMVVQQGANIQKVENNTAQADVLIDDATENVVVADKYSTSARKKILCLVITGVAVTIAVIIILLFVFKVIKV